MIQFMEVLIWIAYLISSYFLIFWLLVFLDEQPDIKEDKKLEDYPSVSVGIPAFNEEDSIAATIDSNKKQDTTHALLSLTT